MRTSFLADLSMLVSGRVTFSKPRHDGNPTDKIDLQLFPVFHLDTLYLPSIRFLKVFFWLKFIDEWAESNSVSQESIWKFGFIKRVHKRRITNLKELESWHFER